MFGSELFDGALWWIFPLLMMVFCFLMMRRGTGSMCGFGSRETGRRHINNTDSPVEIIEKRYSLGEIDREEYEDKKRDLTRS
jgi:putative membrane protein